MPNLGCAQDTSHTGPSCLRTSHQSGTKRGGGCAGAVVARGDGVGAGDGDGRGERSESPASRRAPRNAPRQLSVKRVVAPGHRVDANSLVGRAGGEAPAVVIELRIVLRPRQEREQESAHSEPQAATMQAMRMRWLPERLNVGGAGAGARPAPDAARPKHVAMPKLQPQSPQHQARRSPPCPHAACR